MVGLGKGYYLLSLILFLVAFAYAPLSQLLVMHDLQPGSFGFYILILLFVLLYCGYTTAVLKVTNFEKILESNTAYDLLSDAYFFALVTLLQVTAANVCIPQVPKTQVVAYPPDVQSDHDFAVRIDVVMNSFCWELTALTSLVVGTNSKFGNKATAGVAAVAFYFGSQVIKLTVGPEFSWQKYVSLLGFIAVGCLVVILPKGLATFDWIIPDPRRNYNIVRDGVQLQGFDEYEGEIGGGMYLPKDD